MARNIPSVYLFPTIMIKLLLNQNKFTTFATAVTVTAVAII